jgi:AraC-like DNA-binding protein
VAARARAIRRPAGVAVRRHDSALGRWEMATAPPAGALRGVVQRYCGYIERTAAPLRRREAATGNLTVILSFGPRICVAGEPHQSLVAGLGEMPATTEHDGVQHGIQLDLTPLAARRLLSVPMHDLVNRVVPLADVLDTGTLIEELAEAPDWQRRFARLDAELARRLAAGPVPHPAVRAAYRRLTATRGAVPVGVLAGELGWSRRHLAARFHEDVGVSPKALARLLRFEHAMELIKAGPASLADVAYACGYYDQAHFNRDIRAFAGATPGDLLARRLPDGGGWSADGLPSVQDGLAVAA